MGTIYLIAVTLVLGVIMGSTSIGGVLLVPALQAWSSMEPRTVIGTVLLSFFMSGVVATTLHYRAGRIDFKAAWPLCAGAALFGYAGAVAKQYVPVSVLSGVLGIAIAIAGLSTLRPVKSNGLMAGASQKIQTAGLICIGAGVAFLSGMTGAGGPIIAVPLMLLLGYAPLMTVAVVRPLQLVVTLSGSLGNMAVGAVDYRMAFMIGALLIVGVAAGSHLLRFFKANALRTLVSCICVGTGIFMLVRNLAL